MATFFEILLSIIGAGMIVMLIAMLIAGIIVDVIKTEDVEDPEN